MIEYAAVHNKEIKYVQVLRADNLEEVSMSYYRGGPYKRHEAESLLAAKGFLVTEWHYASDNIETATVEKLDG